MRPLVGDAGGSTVKASHEPRVSTDPSGLVRISGGKYTTFRVMARDVVDAAVGRGMATARPSRTDELPLIGAATRPDLDRLAARLATRAGMDARAAKALVDRHRTEATAVLMPGRQLDLLRPLAAGSCHLQAPRAC